MSSWGTQKQWARGALAGTNVFSWSCLRQKSSRCIWRHHPLETLIRTPPRDPPRVILVGKASTSAARIVFEAVPIRIRPKSCPEARFPARRHLSGLSHGTLLKGSSFWGYHVHFVTVTSSHCLDRRAYLVSSAIAGSLICLQPRGSKSLLVKSRAGNRRFVGSRRPPCLPQAHGKY